MGYLIGGRFEKTGKLQKIEMLKPVQGPGITSFQQRVKRAADISRVAPRFYDPRYSHTTLAVPTDERTLHGLYRYYDDTDAVVGNAIRLHVEFPLSGVALLSCGDPGVQRHFEEMWDRIKGQNMLFDIGLEYWRIGNVIPFLAWNEEDYMWSQIAILNPDYVEVETTWLTEKPLIKLQPDEALRRIVNTRQPEFLFKQLSPEIIKYVRFGQPIPLDPNNVFHISHNKAPYERLGKSLIKRILKLLMYEDRIQEAQFAIATRHIVPLTVVKIGDPNTGWIPEQGEIDAVKEMFSAYELDPNFTVFYHYGISVDFYGAHGKILPAQQELERVLKLKMIGLGISEQLLTGGGTYASSFASLEVMRQRYLHFQLKLGQFVELGLFRTVSEMCGFYRTKKVSYVGDKRKRYGDSKNGKLRNYLSSFTSLRDYKDNEDFKEMIRKKAREDSFIEEQKEFIYPTLDWSLMSLHNQDRYVDLLLRIKDKFPRVVSLETLSKTLHLNKQSEMEQSDVEIMEEELHKKRLKQIQLPEKPTGVGGAPEAGTPGLGIGGPPLGLGMDIPPPLGEEPPAGGAAMGEPPGPEAQRKKTVKVSKEDEKTLDVFADEIEKDLKVEEQRLMIENEEIQKKLERR